MNIFVFSIDDEQLAGGALSLFKCSLGRFCIWDDSRPHTVSKNTMEISKHYKI